MALFAFVIVRPCQLYSDTLCQLVVCQLAEAWGWGEGRHTLHHMVRRAVHIPL